MTENSVINDRQLVEDCVKRPEKESVNIRLDGKSHPIDYLFTGAAIVAGLVFNLSLGE